MSGRPQTPIGTHGKITTKEIKPGTWEAYCRFRDADGQSRLVKRQGQSKTGAENALKKALIERRPDGGVSGEMKVGKLAERWLTQQATLVESGDHSPRTYSEYESAWRLHVEPGLGKLRLREATTARCDSWLTDLRKRHSAATCAKARSVASGILGMAARLDAIPANPMRDVSAIPGSGKRKRKPRAMNADERATWLAWLDGNVAHDPTLPKRPELYRDPVETIRSRALGDVCRLQLATGCRIGEVMALSWDDVDLEAGTVAVRHHLIRVKQRGLVRRQGAKSEAGDRVLRLPSWARDMLLRRRVDPRSGYPIFPDELGGWRDPNLVSRWIRWSRHEAGFDWLTSHVFRQTVISVLDEAGLSTREVADQAGHAHVAQTQRYMQRKVASGRAAEALEDMI